MGIARTRSVGGFTNLVGMNYGGPAGRPRDILYPSTPIGWQKTTNDEVNPGFASRSKRGEIVFSPYSSETWTKQGPLLTSLWAGLNGGVPWEEGGQLPYSHFPYFAPTPPPLSDSLALASAVNQANAGVTPNYASVAVTVAELRQTMDMFRGAGLVASSFANIMIVAARSLKGRKNSLAKQRAAMRDIANLWLQARYGWLPTVYDLQGMMKAFQKPFHPRETSRGTATVTRSGSQVVTASWRGTYGHTSSWKQETTYRAGIMYENMADLGEMYSSRLGLSMADALTVPWELVPLSFAVDWFLDIGDWLRAVSPKPGVRTLASWTVAYGLTEITCHDPFIACTQPGWVGRASGDPFTIRHETRSRSLGATPSIPGYGSGLSINRTIDSAALAFQQLKDLLKFAYR